MKLTTLIFDVDGTLAETEKEGHLIAFNLAFKNASLDWRWDDKLYGHLLEISGGKERIRHYLSLQHPERLKDPHIDKFIAQLHLAKNQHYANLMTTGQIPLRLGVARLIHEAIEKGIRLAIATTTSPENVSALLNNCGHNITMNSFEFIGAGDIVKCKKPAPDIYQHVLEKMKISAAECMAIEDTDNGLCSAHGAGISTIITQSYYTQDQPFDNAALVVDHLGDEHHPCKITRQTQNHITMPCQYVDIALINALMSQ